MLNDNEGKAQNRFGSEVILAMTSHRSVFDIFQNCSTSIVLPAVT